MNIQRVVVAPKREKLAHDGGASLKNKQCIYQYKGSQ